MALPPQVPGMPPKGGADSDAVSRATKGYIDETTAGFVPNILLVDILMGEYPDVEMRMAETPIVNMLEGETPDVELSIGRFGL